MIQLTALSSKELEAIHQATLRILGEIGIELTQPETREILVGAGAKIQGGRVLSPAALGVTLPLSHCPGVFSLFLEEQ